MNDGPALSARIRSLARPLRPRPTGLRPVLRPVPGIKAVLFDIYGTLLVSGAGDFGTLDAGGRPAAMQAAFRAAGVRLSAAESQREAGRLDAALRADRGARQRAGVAHPEVDIEQIWQTVASGVWREQGRRADSLTRSLVRRLAVEYEGRVNPVWPMPGLERMLARLRGAGLVLGLVSNAQFLTPLVLAAFPQTGWSRGVYDRGACAWSYRLGEAKPSLRLARAALRGLRGHGIRAEQVLAVGNDMQRDILPAARLGCRTALFAGDARSLRLRADDPACRALRPDLVMTRLDQLPGALINACGGTAGLL